MSNSQLNFYVLAKSYIDIQIKQYFLSVSIIVLSEGKIKRMVLFLRSRTEYPFSAKFTFKLVLSPWGITFFTSSSTYLSVIYHTIRARCRAQLSSASLFVKTFFVTFYVHQWRPVRVTLELQFSFKCRSRSRSSCLHLHQI